MNPTRAAWLFVLLMVVSFAAFSAAAPNCSWADPGRNPFTGDRQAAIMSYTQMSLADRILLAWRVRFKDPTDTVSIGPNGISGSLQYEYGDISGMHFGRSSRCETVDRSMWPLGHTEPAKAWRQGSWCAIVPDACGNVSLATCDLTPHAAAMGVAYSVPEPGSLGLAAGALAVLAMARRRA